MASPATNNATAGQPIALAITPAAAGPIKRPRLLPCIRKPMVAPLGGPIAAVSCGGRTLGITRKRPACSNPVYQYLRQMRGATR
ncbi:MAG: hypothetical protein ACFCVH_04775 [Alphaproteobacteria bacterium]